MDLIDEAIGLGTGDWVLVQAPSPGIFRIRVNASGIFGMSPMERYGIIGTEWPGSTVDGVLSDKEIKLITASGEIIISRETGEISLIKPSGVPIIPSIIPMATKDGKGVGATVSIGPEELFYGLGYRRTDHIQLRGHAYRNHVAYGESYGPNPFLMSSGGWGLYLNTTYDSYFDIGHTDTDLVRIWSEKGELDLFIMVGGYPELLDSFTRITGRPTLMPIWGYGLMFICNEKENQFDVLNDARTFMQEGLPCDMLGLEPGWMSSHYDLSVKKDWDREKFYMPWWSEDRKGFQDVTFIGALKRYGFNLSLWLSCDYDVFEEEERQAKTKDPAEGKAGSGKPAKPFGFGHLDFDTRAHTPMYQDKLTVKGEAWFEHLKKFVDSGVRAFKQDPAFVVNDHPDRTYANGMTDDEGHNLYQTVLAKQVHLGYKEYTGLRPMHFMGTSYVGVQRWCPTWTCDCGGREPALLGMLQHSLCGHMNITCDMDVHSLEGIHFGFMQPWSQINSWASIDHPWWVGEELQDSFRAYAFLHYGLIPYTYSLAHLGHRTGMPILRAMPLVFPHDPGASELNRQYMFGPSLLVGAYTESIYLPEGGWVDYWTEEAYEGGRTIAYTPPAGRGGALFVRSGSIIPMAKEGLTNLRKPIGTLVLHLYPGATGTATAFEHFEDDGVTFGFEVDEVAVTSFKAEWAAGSVALSIGEREGGYKGMPGVRHYEVAIHSTAPLALSVNGETIPNDSMIQDAVGKIRRVAL